MADNYRLAALLKLRVRAREEAEQALAKAQSEQTKAQRAVDAAARFLEDCRARLDEAKAQLYAGDGLTIGIIQTREAFTHRLSDERDEADEAHQRCEDSLKAAQEEVRRANAGLIEAKQEEEALLKHKEKWLKEQQVIQRRREEDAADDVAQTMWRQKK